MCYFEDLQKLIKEAEEWLMIMEECLEKDYSTAYHCAELALEGRIKSMKFCLECRRIKIKRLREGKLGFEESAFKCPGGCVRPGVFEEFSQANEGIKKYMGIVNYREIKKAERKRCD